MKKIFILLTALIFPMLLTACSSSIDKEVTLVRGETSVWEVENLLGSPSKKAMEGNRLRYDYNSASLVRDLTTELLIGWRFLDNHVLNICDAGRTNCKLYKGGEDEDAKALRVYFENGVVSDAKLLDLAPYF